MTDQTPAPSYDGLVVAFNRTFIVTGHLVTEQMSLPDGHQNKWAFRTLMIVASAYALASNRARQLSPTSSESDLQHIFGKSLTGTFGIMSGLRSLSDMFKNTTPPSRGDTQLPTCEEILHLREQIRQLAQAGSGEDLSHLACQA
jgi:hypothetical protein